MHPDLKMRTYLFINRRTVISLSLKGYAIIWMCVMQILYGKIFDFPRIYHIL